MLSYKLTKYASLGLSIPACILLMSASYAQPVYKWQDAKGAVHYTQTPPPAGAKAQTVEVRSRTNLQPVTINSAPAADATPANTSNKTAGNTQAASGQQKLKLKPEDCQKLKDALETLKTDKRIYESDKNGERAYLSDEQRAERISSYSKNVSEGCS